MDNLFELGMLVLFGISWPISVVKSYKSRTSKGKSLMFMLFIWFGYVSGIINKIYFDYDYVIFLYFINIFFVTLDIGLYYRNKKIDKM